MQNLRPLTSLRFFAALAIVLLHAKLYTKWGWLDYLPTTLLHGVSFFFVLSGFILTHVYHARKDFPYSSFIRLRIARLWPVHVFTLLIMILAVTPPTFGGDGFFDRRLTLIANLSLVQSMSPFISYVFSWNSVSWSISTELFFYLAFPFLLVRIERSWGIILLLSAILLLGICALLGFLGLPVDGSNVEQITITSATYANPLTRGFEFCVGMAAWVFWNRKIAPLKGPLIAWTAVEIVSLVVAVLWLTKTFYVVVAKLPFPWLLPWVEDCGSFWLFAILIVIFAGGRGVIGRILAQAPLVWLGEISFAVYMVHQILFKIFAWRLGITSEFLFFPALIAASAAVHYWIEQPGRALLSGRRTKIVFQVPAKAGG